MSGKVLIWGLIIGVALAVFLLVILPSGHGGFVPYPTRSRPIHPAAPGIKVIPAVIFLVGLILLFFKDEKTKTAGTSLLVAATSYFLGSS